MSFPNPPDVDSLWDYSDPAHTERKFREILLQIPEEDPAFLELLTQIARAQGLQRKFKEAHKTLNQVQRRLGKGPSRARVRYLLERGRVLASSRRPGEARPFFEKAFEVARELREDYYAVDALHMLAIIAPADESLTLNLQAIEMAQSSSEEKARTWLGSLYNNTGWSFHAMGDYSSALAIFEKAEAWQRAMGRENETRIAAWCVARALRSLGRFEEALSRQMALEHEWAEDGETDGYVFEEIGECLRALNRTEEARPYFSTAYALLKADPWLAENEPARLERLRQLGSTS
jgi:tetratricopeptide (TPR) repeat protein